MNIMSHERRTHAISLLVDGLSIRATANAVDAHQDTIGRLALHVGEGCQRLHDGLMRNLRLKRVQIDEQHSYVHTRQVNLKKYENQLPEWGEQWTFAALDVESRAIVVWLVGKRTEENAKAFVEELRRRMESEKNLAGDVKLVVKPMIAADGLNTYPNAIELAFGTEITFGQLVKAKQVDEIEDKRIKRLVKAAIKEDEGRVQEHYKHAVRVPIFGNPPIEDVHTSYIERMNRTTREGSRRFVRRTTGFSKKLRHHKAAVALQYTHYNLVRVHETLRTTPAMALKVADHVWTVRELIDQALAAPVAPSLPPLVPPSKPDLPKHSRWHGVEPERTIDSRKFFVYPKRT